MTERFEERFGKMAQVTRRFGWLALDYLNAAQVRAAPIPFDERWVGSRQVELEGSMCAGERGVCKTIAVGKQRRLFTKRVQVCRPAELVNAFKRCGSVSCEALGSYAGAPHGANSRRTIAIASGQ